MGSAIYYLSPPCYYGTYTDSDDEYEQTRRVRRHLENAADLFYLPNYMFADTSVFRNTDTADPAGRSAINASYVTDGDDSDTGYNTDTDCIEMVSRYDWARSFVPI